MCIRDRIVVKLLALYPRVQDPAITAEAYIQELESVPAFWLRKACKSISSRSRADVQWLPLVGDIKTEAARLHQEYRNRAQHGLPYDPTHRTRRLAVGRELHLMKEGPIPVSRQLGSGKAIDDN